MNFRSQLNNIDFSTTEYFIIKKFAFIDDNAKSSFFNGITNIFNTDYKVGGRLRIEVPHSVLLSYKHSEWICKIKDDLIKFVNGCFENLEEDKSIVTVLYITLDPCCNTNTNNLAPKNDNVTHSEVKKRDSNNFVATVALADNQFIILCPTNPTTVQLDTGDFLFAWGKVANPFIFSTAKFPQINSCMFIYFDNKKPSINFWTDYVKKRKRANDQDMIQPKNSVIDSFLKPLQKIIEIPDSPVAALSQLKTSSPDCFLSSEADSLCYSSSDDDNMTAKILSFR
jgi:hypothetical protein